jgi:DNA modification methylase
MNDDRADWREAWALFPGDVIYVWHAGTKAAIVAESLEASGFEIRTQIIWAKNNFAIGRGHYHVQHEPCWYAVRKGSAGHWMGDHSQTSLWRIDKPLKSETGHSTQKPVECMRRPIENNSSPGQVLYEPFSGSGTTIIAAEMTGRACHAIEISPAYVDVAVERWQNFTGKKAVLANKGHSNVPAARNGMPITTLEQGENTLRPADRAQSADAPARKQKNARQQGRASRARGAQKVKRAPRRRLPVSF